MRRLAARFWVIVAGLLLLHFVVRPRLGDPRFTPDFLFVALLFYAIRSRPGAGAVAGLLVGLAVDALAPTAFGAAALAHTVVGYLAGWLRAYVVADNAPITALFIAAAAWLRDLLLVVVAGQVAGSALLWQVFGFSPVAALTTAAAAFAVMIVARGLLTSRVPA
jgi:rod shape-determining protein MreD